MVEDVEPLLHWYVANPVDALRVALLPWQTTNVPPITGAGFGVMATVCDAVPVQPVLLVTVTV